jgi:MoaA/NifB/PqqE/SkfB family radical SAM enzyme
MKKFKDITECQIFLTRKCNLHCGYCKIVKKPVDKELNINEWKKAFRILDDIGIKTVKILGGEPTILEGFEDLLMFINDETLIKYAVLSNSMFDDEKTDSLVDAGMQGYFASVDGIENVKGVDECGVAKSHAGFDKLIKFKQKGIKLLGANVVITKKNLSDIPEIVKILSDNGIWVNLCPVIHGKEDFWEFRTEVPGGFRFTDTDIPKLNDIMTNLLQMKLGGYKIAVPDSYLINMSKFGIHINWKCKELVQLRIDADGALMLCNDIRGEVAKKYNILYMDKEKFVEFKKDWKKERAKKDCPGCYWSCFLVAEDNLKNNKLEFDYIKRENERN